MNPVKEASWLESIGGFVLPTLSDTAVDRVWGRLSAKDPQADNQEYTGWRGRVVTVFSKPRAGIVFGCSVAVAGVAAAVLIFPVVVATTTAGTVGALGWTWAGIKLAGSVKDAAAKGYAHLTEGTRVGLRYVAPAAVGLKNWTLDKTDAVANRLLSRGKVDSIKGAINGLVDFGNSVAGAFGSTEKVIALPQHEDWDYELRDQAIEALNDVDALTPEQRELLVRQTRASKWAESFVREEESKVASYDTTIARGGALGAFAKRFKQSRAACVSKERSKEMARKSDASLKDLQVTVLVAKRKQEDHVQQATRIEEIAKSVLGAGALAALMFGLGWASFAALVFTAATVLVVEGSHLALCSTRLSLDPVRA